ncbi:hypothetical protein, partial [Halalkalibacter okhensis]|uniref:hypothetical protein n=1 Tax=Halalkalibacter okhensis TaxID=333138 RepID=UPI001F3418BD
KKLYTGDTYFFSAGKFHRIIPTAPKTVSFLIRSEAVLPYTRIIDPNSLVLRKSYGSKVKFINQIKSVMNDIRNENYA